MQMTPTCINVIGGVSMPFLSKDKPIVSASISAIENGLFHITYCTDRTVHDLQRLPNYHVGTSISDVREKVQNLASLFGFGMIAAGGGIGGAVAPSMNDMQNAGSAT